jgi:hypothetical protein
LTNYSHQKERYLQLSLPSKKLILWDCSRMTCLFW